MSSIRLSAPLALAVVLGFSSARPATAQTPEQPWTSVGSAGTVDEEDLLLVQLGTPIPGAVSMRPVLRGALNVRYNVVALPGALDGSGISLTARYLDRGDQQRVFLELKEYSFVTGVTTTLLTLDSDAFPASPAFQVQSVGTNPCTPPFVNLDFAQNAYFVDATLSRSPFGRLPVEPPIATFGLVEPSNAGGPALGAIKVDSNVCIL